MRGRGDLRKKAKKNEGKKMGFYVRVSDVSFLDVYM